LPRLGRRRALKLLSRGNGSIVLVLGFSEHVTLLVLPVAHDQKVQVA
jgi:hypothetical protein